MFQYNTLTLAVFVIIFGCALLFVSSLLFFPLRFFSGSHFLCPSTFFFVVFPFPFSPSSSFPPNIKSPISSFLHYIFTVPPLLLFYYMYSTFTSFASLFSYCFPVCFITFSFSLHFPISTST
jgi:hypothetical protein